MADEENSRLLVSGENYRNAALAKNSAGYTPANEYCAGSPDTISDGDNRGREPESNGSTIGTKIDIDTRNAALAKNSDGYTPDNQYCAGSPDTISDGDNRGRNPESNGSSIGTKIDIDTRNAALAKNSGGYTPDNQYCAGSPDTISDGDNRGREPESNGSTIGTKIDIDTRNAALAKNSCLYTACKPYGPSNA